ncbi:DUF2169 family type VI secretion system accessory protein [Tateyamaria pelophila]|uniref:DUF2169 family type VI secretion system accessory protein n=1 Tax=Tateyamaria pelophila TaxID=328415 RepID=UPI001CBAEE0A|nr:DUF2169 domain-containing protein [Tateyamaria pelophila]
MWLLINETPFAAERTWTRDERGAEFWLVAVRASFKIDLDGRQSTAKEQTEVQRFPVFAGDPMTTGLITDSDFVLSKTGTDVLVNGRAITPDRRPETRSQVRIKLADIDKSLDVVGDRRIYSGALGLAMTEPNPFIEMPITWERTYGGWDRQGKKEAWEPSNPAGCGFARYPSHLFDTQAPNIEYPDAPYHGARSSKPAALGPVAHHWQPRVRYAGTYDAVWAQNRDPLPPVDFDRRYYRSAPLDQQTAEPLVGYEEVRIGGMTPDGFLGFILPRITFDMITTFKGGGDVRQTPTVHTLWLMPNRRRFEMVWLSALEVPPGRDEKLVGTTIRIRPRMGTPDSIRRTGVWRPD